MERRHRRSRTKRPLRRYATKAGALLMLCAAALAWFLVLRSEDGSRVDPSRPADTPAGSTRSDSPGPALVKLPADDAPHENATEWWYYNGLLQGNAGERYSMHMVAFLRRGLLTHTAFHAALRDHQTGKYYTAQARTAGNASVSAGRGGFDFRFGDWRVAGTNTEHALAMQSQDFALDLALSDANPPLLHQAPGSGGLGLLDFGAAGKSYYYSRPRMAASGSVSVGGARKTVKGVVWFDHQWGDFEASRMRWNWFALQLDDGADLMLYEIFDRSGAPLLLSGTYSRKGKVIALAAADFKTRSESTWKSPDSSAIYPMDWTVVVPRLGLNLKLTPVAVASEFVAFETTLNVYWEGAVQVTGSHTGRGFLEMSGYDKVVTTPKQSSRPASAPKTPVR